jgi:hypothetical protein
MMLCVQSGQTALSIAQRLGYISVVEILRHITDVTVQPLSMEDKYKVTAPETMQEAPMSDSEEEGGRQRFLSRNEPPDNLYKCSGCRTSANREAVFE